MIHFQSVKFQYPESGRGVSDLNINIEDGDFVAVIGSSGAGKTTFLRLINGMLTPSGGELRVLETDMVSANARALRKLRTQIGFIYQQFNLVKRLTVMDNVLIGRLGYHSALSGALGLYFEHDRELAKLRLKEVDLLDRAYSPVDKLSGGQQQRVAIARALVQCPQIVLADEPMASLDPHLSEVILDLLKMANQRDKITVVVNIHVLELAKKYARRILGFNGGHLVFDGTPAQLDDHATRKIYG